MRGTPATTTFRRSILGPQVGESKAKSRHQHGLTARANPVVGRTMLLPSCPAEGPNILGLGPGSAILPSCYNLAFRGGPCSPDPKGFGTPFQIGTFLPAGSYPRMCARHPCGTVGGYPQGISWVSPYGPGRCWPDRAKAPDGDGNNETLEKNRDWHRRGGSIGHHRRYHGASERQERSYGADREGTAPGLVFSGERFGRNQAQDVR